MRKTIILLIFCLISVPIIACKCISISFTDGYSQSDLVFIGKVDKIEDYDKSCQDNMCREYSVEFEISRIVKGCIEQIKIHTFKDTGGCGFPFRLKEEYLVYATNSWTNSYRVGLCSRTAKLETNSAQSDLNEIEKK